MADSWETLKLLADSTRVRILSLLNQEELSVAELQEVLDMGQSRISSHLGLLRQGELVLDRREGKKTFTRSTRASIGKVANSCRQPVPRWKNRIKS